MSTAFTDVKPFPANPRAGMGDNRPPLDETVVADFLEGLRAERDLPARIAELTERGNAAGECQDEETAGRYGDYIKMAREAAKAVDAERERHNRPILTAQRALVAKARSLTDPLECASGHVRKKLDAFMWEQRRKADEARRVAEETARKAREAAEREAIDAGQDPTSAPIVDVRPAEIAEPVARGDLGSRVGSTTAWLHEIESVRQLPDRILKHEKVVEALNKLIAAEVRGGAREIKGCRIWSEQRTAVR